MKTRLSLMIESDLFVTIKSIALRKETSVSELVEEHFKLLAKFYKRTNILQLVETLPDSIIDKNADLKGLYYQSKLDQ